MVLTPDPIRRTARRMAAHGARMLMPQARYSQMVLVLSHMRSASTALSNVLTSHAALTGYGETHVCHDGAHAPGQVLVNLARRRAFDRRASLLLDKVLHNRLDDAPPPEFYTARGLFLLRGPGPVIASIRALSARTGLDEGRSADAAAQYYLARVTHLATHWARFAPQRRLGLTNTALLADPDAQIARIGQWLALTPPLENRYHTHPAAQVGGGGDPLCAARLSAITPRISPPTGADLPPDLPPQLPRDLAARCMAAHDTLAALFAAD